MSIKTDVENELREFGEEVASDVTKVEADVKGDAKAAWVVAGIIFAIGAAAGQLVFAVFGF